MRHLAIALAVLLPAAGADPVAAQELASTFDQLRVLVKAGDRLTITDQAGQEVRGRLVRLDGSELEIDAEGRALVFQQDRLAMIRQRQQDSLANGAWIGFWIGTGFGTLAGVAMHEEFGSAGAIPLVALVYGAMGTGIGVWVDGALPTHRVVFSRPSSRAASFSVGPAVNGRVRGIRIELAW